MWSYGETVFILILRYFHNCWHTFIKVFGRLVSLNRPNYWGIYVGRKKTEVGCSLFGEMKLSGLLCEEFYFVVICLKMKMVIKEAPINKKIKINWFFFLVLFLLFLFSFLNLNITLRVSTKSFTCNGYFECTSKLVVHTQL